MAAIKSLKDWQFSEPKLTRLPLDQEVENYIRRDVRKCVFSIVQPTAYKTKPKLIAFSSSTLRDVLDMDPAIVEEEEFVNWVTGNSILEGSTPLAHRYGGYQFGYWADQLGDGRAHLLGEYVNTRGERWELQLKGSGKTPYSRFGDGRAVLRSSLREFLCSEAMYYLDVPTSRAATLVVTDDPVPRDMFYDGHPKNERGAVVLRVAPTWFRFGSFEILSKKKELDELKQLADFSLLNLFPHISEKGEAAYLTMFAEVCEQTAGMIAKWDAIGFTHGVMNTDNMSLGSITIDYGPFGFVDAYDPTFTPNHSDDEGRYDLENQANIGMWNLNKLAEALKPLIQPEKHQLLGTILQGYGVHYSKARMALYRRKLGLQIEVVDVRNKEISQETEQDQLVTASDEDLVELLLNIMDTTKADFTQTFRDLSELSLADLESHKIPEAAWGLSACFKSKRIKEFIRLYAIRLRTEGHSDEKRMEDMQSINPRYILRNWIAQAAIQRAEEDDFSEVQFLLQLLTNPYRINHLAEQKGYASPPPKWSAKLVLSCSS